MNKTELVEKIAAGAGLSKVDAKKALDNTYDGLITNLERQQPKLTNVDVKFICLDCCDFPPGVIMLLMGYTTTHSVENRRYVIAKRLGYKIKDLVINRLSGHN